MSSYMDCGESGGSHSSGFNTYPQLMPKPHFEQPPSQALISSYLLIFYSSIISPPPAPSLCVCDLYTCLNIHLLIYV